MIPLPETLAPTLPRGLFLGRFYLRFPPWVWLLTASVFGLACTAAFWAHHREIALRQAEFDEHAGMVINRLEERLSSLDRLLQALAGAVDPEASDFDQVWPRVAEPLGASLMGVDSLAFVRLVPGSERSGFEGKKHQAGELGFAIFPAGERSEYAVVTHLVTLDGNLSRLYGYDLLMDPQRRQVLHATRDGGGMVIQVKAASQDAGASRFAQLYCYRAVYAPRLPVSMVEMRRQALRGFVFAMLDVEAFLGAQSGTLRAFSSFSLYAGVDQQEASLLADTRRNLPLLMARTPARYKHEQVLQVGGQVWTIVAASLPGFEESHPQGLFIVVVASGAALVFLVLLCSAWMSGVRELVESKAKQMTAELRESEGALQRSNTELSEVNAMLADIGGLHRAILEHAGYAIIATDSEGTITVFNPAAEAMLGYAAVDLVGRQTPALFHDAREVQQRAREFSEELGEDIKPGFDVFVAHSKRGLPNQHEWIYVRRDGSRLPVQLVVSMLSDEQHRIRGYLGVAVDLSERKRVEMRLNASVREIRDLKVALDAQAIVEICDRHGRITSVNDNFCLTSKYSRGEVLGHDHRILNSGYHTREFFASMYASLNRGEVWTGEVRNRAKDGSVFWVDTTIVPFRDARGDIYEYVVIRTDITQRKEAEQARLASEALLRQFVFHVPAAVAMLDDRGRFLHVSERWTADFQLVPPLVGTHLVEHPSLPPEWSRVLSDVLAGNFRSGDEAWAELPSGVRICLRWEARPWLRSDHSAGGSMIFAQICRRESLASTAPSSPSPSI